MQYKGFSDFDLFEKLQHDQLFSEQILQRLFEPFDQFTCSSICQINIDHDLAKSFECSFDLFYPVYETFNNIYFAFYPNNDTFLFTNIFNKTHIWYSSFLN